MIPSAQPIWSAAAERSGDAALDQIKHFPCPTIQSAVTAGALQICAKSPAPGRLHRTIKDLLHYPSRTRKIRPISAGNFDSFNSLQPIQ
jgi:hypothetical protein